MALRQDCRDASLNMQGRRKRSMTLKSKAVKEVPMTTGDLMEVYRRCLI